MRASRSCLAKKGRRGSYDRHHRNEGRGAAPMSSACGEAEDGHAHSTSTANEGYDQNNVETNAEYGADDLVELSRPTVSSQSESEPEKSEDENGLSITEKAVYDHESDTTKDASQEAHVAAAHLLGDGRPSSADGSLSIPDDSPSIQVREGLPS